MKANQNEMHPRMVINDELVPLPIMSDFGNLIDSMGDKIREVDGLGINTGLYFKLLKALAILFMLFTVISSPIYFIYSTGNMSLQANNWRNELLSEYTLGNIGETTLLCNKRNVKQYDKVKLWCPDGTQMKSI